MSTLKNLVITLLSERNPLPVASKRREFGTQAMTAQESYVDALKELAKPRVFVIYSALLAASFLITAVAVR